MLDRIEPAGAGDLEATWLLYEDVCAHQDLDAYGPRWTLGVYPARSDIEGHVRAGDLYVGRAGERIACAMVVTPHEDPEYAGVPWKLKAAPDEVAVIHLLAVSPDLRGRGLGAELVRAAIDIARRGGARVMHLDVVPGNLAASRIYEEAGFSLACTHEIFYEDTGLMAFDMYELAL